MIWRPIADVEEPDRAGRRSASRRPPSAHPARTRPRRRSTISSSRSSRPARCELSDARYSSRAPTTRASNCVQLRRRSSANVCLVPAARRGRRHRVERVGDEDDARSERDLVARQPERVAGAVPPLVVVADPAVDRRHAQAPRAAGSPAPGCSRMIRSSSGSSLPGFCRMRSGIAILRRSWRRPASRSTVSSEPHRPGDPLGEPPNGLRVGPGVVLRVDDADQALGGAPGGALGDVRDLPPCRSARRSRSRGTSGSCRGSSPSRATRRRPSEVVAVVGVVGVRGDARADMVSCRGNVVCHSRWCTRSIRVGDRPRPLGEEERELLAADPVGGLRAERLAQDVGHLLEDAVPTGARSGR